jgi:prophage tail gpP-like protein
MADQTGAPEIHFPDGSKLASFTSFSATETFNDPLPRFTFTAAPPSTQADAYAAQLQKGEFVTLKVNGASQGGFLVQTVKTVISASGGKTFHVEAISPLITPYQGSVDPDVIQLHSPTDVQVSDFILNVMRPYGFDTIITDTAASVNALTGVEVRGRKPATDASKLKHQDAQAQDGETAYACCAKVFSHLGVCMRLSVDGTLLVQAPDYVQPPLYSLVQGTGVGDRFMGEIEITDSNDEQFSEVVVRGNRVASSSSDLTARPAGFIRAIDVLPANPTGSFIDPNSLIPVGGSKQTTTTVAAAQALAGSRAIYRSTPAPFKPKNRRDKQARDNARCLSKAKELLGRTAWRAFHVKASVNGFVSQTGAVWAVDTVASVKIDAYGLNENMWIMSREFHLDGTGGTKTMLTLIPLGSLLLGDVPE